MEFVIFCDGSFEDKFEASDEEEATKKDLAGWVEDNKQDGNYTTIELAKIIPIKKVIFKETNNDKMEVEEEK